MKLSPHSHHHTPQAGEARRKETLLQMVDAAVLLQDYYEVLRCDVMIQNFVCEEKDFKFMV